MQALLLLYLIIEDHDNLFVLAELAHFSGIGFLLYKLYQEETCSGMALFCILFKLDLAQRSLRIA